MYNLEKNYRCQIMNNFKELYAYREMIFSLVRKDLRTRYKGSVLGFLWTFLNPLLQLIVYSIAFAYIMRVNLPNYYIFMFVGLLPWMFFCTCVQGGAISVILNADLLKKIYFPRIVLPIATVSAAFLNMLFSMVIMFAALFISGIGVSEYIIYYPFYLVLLYCLGLGLSFIFSACNVYFRDLEHILGILTMSMFYVTPVIYPLDMVPDNFLPYFKLNPMAFIVCGFQDIFYYKRAPEIESILSIVAFSLFILMAGYIIFQKLQKRFVEEL